MNQSLLELRRKFGKYGSWALWDEDGSITSLIDKNDFEFKIKPNIVFIGLNASRKLPNDWINFHSECARYFEPSWKATHSRKLAEVLLEDEFQSFSGAYMTDIIKDHYDADSSMLIERIRCGKDIVGENVKLFKQELCLLSKISGSDDFKIICIGTKTFDILSREFEKNVYKIWHYSAYQLGWEGVKERIRKDLRGIAKNY